MSTTITRPTVTSIKHRTVAVATAVLAAALTWLLGRALGADFVVDQPPVVVVGLSSVLGFSLGASLLGWAGLAVLERFLPRRARPVWTALAVAVLALSFLPLLGVGAAPLTRLFLALTHLAVGGVLIARLGRGLVVHVPVVVEVGRQVGLGGAPGLAALHPDLAAPDRPTDRNSTPPANVVRTPTAAAGGGSSGEPGSIDCASPGAVRTRSRSAPAGGGGVEEAS